MFATTFQRYIKFGVGCVCARAIQSRNISGADAINALRPFYFAVHPDFFGQHPKEREVNENSLKRLNGYLENLQKPGARFQKPTNFTFYVRDTKERVEPRGSLILSGFRSVNFTLQSKDVLSTVLDVLKSCSLPVEHVQTVTKDESRKSTPQQTATAFHRPIRWDKTYYTFTGFRDPEQELEQARRVQPTLSIWLRSNEPAATKKHSASVPRREELKRLKKELIHKLGLLDIRWQRGWGVAHRCCQLQSLSRLSAQNPSAIFNLKGHIIIFTDQSGMNASGHVMLGTMDVHHQWTKFFERLPSYRKLLEQANALKERISHLLGGVQVIHIEHLGPGLTLEEHYNTLSTFHRRMLPLRLALHPRSLQGLSMTLENDRTTPTLHEMGHFIIPTMCDGLHLQSFLQSQAPEARRRLQHNSTLEAEEASLISSCVHTLSLRSLCKETSVSSGQMIPCCQRLIQQSWPSMQGLRLCISHFYSVMQDGDLCIPWDWKG
ncbi:hypothetical protein DNTS_003684 [Danionella cerebrum]|uniref:DUF4460 domain-containing protein n=1 Tax=Danionella cerebrum TaxID=2873325 RepID=A0A553QLM3_9TELE|nr:hypothetical protein DNTS_003684 [Danionella translucida]TRY90616.1 hypothetical protein DNTS_003684 [Danionella translucida]